MRFFDWIKIAFFWVVLPVIAVLMGGILRFKSLSINLPVALVCFTAYRKGASKGALMGLITGFIEDNMGGIILGPFMLSRSVAGVLCTFLYERMIIWNPIFSNLVLFLMSLVDDALAYVAISIFVQHPYGLGYFIGTALLRAILTAPLGLFFKIERHET